MTCVSITKFDHAGSYSRRNNSLKTARWPRPSTLWQFCSSFLFLFFSSLFLAYFSAGPLSFPDTSAWNGLNVVSDYGPITATTPSRVLFSAPSANSTDVLWTAVAASRAMPTFRLQCVWKNVCCRGERIKSRGGQWGEIKRNEHRSKGRPYPGMIVEWTSEALFSPRFVRWGRGTEEGKIKGAERAQRFNYDRSARSTLDKYRSVWDKGAHLICFLDPKGY